jgi:putative FmdB family regulatory protein
VPTYQYACTACGEQLEAVQSFTDAALTECPACGGALRKVFSAVGVVFKGSGFYKNDSRKASSGTPKSGGSESGGSSDGAATTPAAKSKDSTTTAQPASTTTPPAAKTA